MRYRKIETALWADERFAALSGLEPSGKALFLALLAHPGNGPMPGVIITGPGALADLLGWTADDLLACCRELDAQGMARFGFAIDEPARNSKGATKAQPKRPPTCHLVWLPKALKHNMPSNGKMVIGWASAWADVPESTLKREIAQHFAATLSGRWPAEVGRVMGAYCTANGIGYGIGYGIRSQEQEQEQEQEHPPTPLTGGGRECETARSEESKEPAAGGAVPPATNAALAGLGMLAGPAKLIADLYRKSVKNPHGVGGGIQAVTECLSAGATADALRAAVANYAAHVKRERVEPRYVLSVTRFFREAWRDYADPDISARPAPPPRPAKVDEAPEVSDEARRRVREMLRAERERRPRHVEADLAEAIRDATDGR